jgi:hypothetical protein
LDEQHPYEDCWNGMCKCNLANPKQWLDISTILLSFPTRKNTTNKNQITIATTYDVELTLVSMLLMPQPICEGCS